MSILPLEMYNIGDKISLKYKDPYYYYIIPYQE